VTILSEARGES